jgi:4-amino-4-deoxychorismate lyase
MFWINGKPADSVALADRSFQYGDGCFTTMLTINGRIQNWSLHTERMQACLDLLDIRAPDWNEVERWLQHAASPDKHAGLKLHISRGEGGRGYSPVGAESPTVTISQFSFPSHYYQWRKDGIELGICQHKMGLNPLLAGHKHNNRLEQVLLRSEVDQMGVQDGIVCDIQGHVVETTMANLFWVKGKTLYTPGMDMCGVAGVVRRTVIQDAPSMGLKVLIGEFELDHLDNADEVFITNSVLGVAPVISIGSKRYTIGPVTRKIQENQSS